jgi:hypothetical protein
MHAISKARRQYEKTGSFADASAKTGINRQTIKTWARRYGWRRPLIEELKPELKPKGAWMQSLHHETAHFILNGLPACSGSPNGAKVNAGDRWLVWDGCVRKCLRCIHHAEQ